MPKVANWSATREWIIAIPFLHIMFCSAYIVGFISGFGHNVGSFVGIENIFNVGIHKMAYVYSLAIAWPLFLRIYRHTGKYAYEQDRVDAITDDSERESAQIELDKFRIILLIFVIGLSLLIWLLAYRIYVETTVIDAVFIFWGFWMLFSFMPIWLAKRLNLYYPIADVMEILLGAAIFSFALGFTQGQGDLKDSLDGRDHALYCPDGTQLRSRVGDNFVALRTNSEIVIVDISCNVVALVE